jgi:hypothetical protein
MSEDNKRVTSERHKWTKAERQYIKGIVHIFFSLQRLTDQDIVDYLMNGQYIRYLKPYLASKTLDPFEVLIPGLKLTTFNAVTTIRIGTPVLLTISAL